MVPQLQKDSDSAINIELSLFGGALGFCSVGFAVAAATKGAVQILAAIIADIFAAAVVILLCGLSERVTRRVKRVLILIALGVMLASGVELLCGYRERPELSGRRSWRSRKESDRASRSASTGPATTISIPAATRIPAARTSTSAAIPARAVRRMRRTTHTRYSSIASVFSCFSEGVTQPLPAPEDRSKCRECRTRGKVPINALTKTGYVYVEI